MNGPATGVLASAPIRCCFSGPHRSVPGTVCFRAILRHPCSDGSETAWSTLRAMHSDLGESISRAWNDPCMLRAALWSEALFSALDYMQLGHIGDYYVIKALEVLFLLHAQRGAGPDTAVRLPYPKPDRDHTRIQKYMVGHLDERLTVRSLSQQFRISGTALKSCFRQVYGVPVHQYLLEQRMARAAELLTTTTQSVLQISTVVGYSSVSQFGIAFKRRYHMPPAQFRRNANKIHLQRFLTRTDRKPQILMLL